MYESIFHWLLYLKLLCMLSLNGGYSSVSFLFSVFTSEIEKGNTLLIVSVSNGRWLLEEIL